MLKNEKLFFIVGETTLIPKYVNVEVRDIEYGNQTFMSEKNRNNKF